MPGFDDHGEEMTDMAKVTWLLGENTPLRQVVDPKVGEEMTDMAKVTWLLDENTPLGQVVDLMVGVLLVTVRDVILA